MSFGTFNNPFLNNREDYAKLTGGITGFSGFRAGSYNPLLNPKVAPSAESIKARAIARASSLGTRFALQNYPAGAYAKPEYTLAAAQTDLAGLILQITGNRPMWDPDGYLAYQIVDRYNQTSYSSNLSRLKRAFQRGPPDDDGPIIKGLGAPTGDSARASTNKMWQVVIAWHKLLNATKGYTNEYRNRSITENYNRMAGKRIQGITNRLYFYAAQPAEYAKWQDKRKASLVKMQNRFIERDNIIKGVVDGIVSAREAAAIVQENANPNAGGGGGGGAGGGGGGMDIQQQGGT